MLSFNDCYCFSVKCSDPQDKIQTDPILVEDIVARNFSGLKLSIKFLDDGKDYIWMHPSLTFKKSKIFSGSCINTIESDFTATCRQITCDGFTYILSSLILMFPIDKDVTFDVSLDESSQAPLASINIKVKGKLKKDL